MVGSAGNVKITDLPHRPYNINQSGGMLDRLMQIEQADVTAGFAPDTLSQGFTSRGGFSLQYSYDESLNDTKLVAPGSPLTITPQFDCTGQHSGKCSTLILSLDQPGATSGGSGSHGGSTVKVYMALTVYTVAPPADAFRPALSRPHSGRPNQKPVYRASQVDLGNLAGVPAASGAPNPADFGPHGIDAGTYPGYPSGLPRDWGEGPWVCCMYGSSRWELTPLETFGSGYANSVADDISMALLYVNTDSYDHNTTVHRNLLYRLIQAGIDVDMERTERGTDGGHGGGRLPCAVFFRKMLNLPAHDFTTNAFYETACFYVKSTGDPASSGSYSPRYQPVADWLGCPEWSSRTNNVPNNSRTEYWDGFTFTEGTAGNYRYVSDAYYGATLALRLMGTTATEFYGATASYVADNPSSTTLGNAHFDYGDRFTIVDNLSPTWSNTMWDRYRPDCGPRTFEFKQSWVPPDRTIANAANFWVRGEGVGNGVATVAQGTTVELYDNSVVAAANSTYTWATRPNGGSTWTTVGTGRQLSIATPTVGTYDIRLQVTGGLEKIRLGVLQVASVSIESGTSGLASVGIPTTSGMNVTWYLDADTGDPDTDIGGQCQVTVEYDGSGFVDVQFRRYGGTLDYNVFDQIANSGQSVIFSSIPADGAIEVRLYPSDGVTRIVSATATSLRDFDTRIVELNPGIIRDWTENFLGASVDQRWYGVGTSGFKPEDQTVDSNFLPTTKIIEWCELVSADPWLTIPPGFTSGEANTFVTRALQNSTASTIYLELSNEAWGGGGGGDPFRGASFSDMDHYIDWAEWMTAQIKTNRSAAELARLKFVFGGQSPVPSQQTALATSTASIVALGPYYARGEGDGSEAYSLSFQRAEANAQAELEANLSILDAANKPAAIYEMGPHSNLAYDLDGGGAQVPVDPTLINDFLATPQAGLIAAKHCLEHLVRGVTEQCWFTFSQYDTPNRDFSGEIKLWGMFDTVDSTRPAFDFISQLNAILGDASTVVKADEDVYEVGAFDVTLDFGNGTMTIVQRGGRGGVEVASAAALTGVGANTKQTFTVEGFGTPVAALFLMTTNTSLDTVVGPGGGSGFSFGFTDGTTSRVVCHACGDDDEDAVKASCTNRVIMALDYITESSTVGEASFSRFIEDGVEITWNKVLADSRLITVVLLGSNVTDQAKVISTLSTSTPLDITSIGFNPDLVISLSPLGGSSGEFVQASSASLIQPHNSISLGVATDGGAHQQAFSYFNTQNTTTVAAAVASAAIQAYHAPTFTGNSLTVSDFDDQGLTITEASSGAQEVALLCLSMPTTQVWSGRVQTPTSTGSEQTIAGLPFKPNFLMMFTSRIPTLDTRDQTANAGAFGVAVTDGVTSRHVTQYFDVGAGTNNVGNLISDSFIEQRLDDRSTGTGYHKAEFVSFDSDGATLNWTSTDSTAREFIAIATQFKNPEVARPKVATFTFTANAPFTGGPYTEHFDDDSAVYLRRSTPVSVSDSEYVLSGTGFLHTRHKVDRSQSQLIMVCMRQNSVTTTNCPDMIQLCNSFVEPAEFTSGAVALQRRVAMTLDSPSAHHIRLGYFPGGGDSGDTDWGGGYWWDGSGEAWGSIGVEEEAVASLNQSGDYYTYGLQLDGPNNRFRMFAIHGAGASEAVTTHGQRITALTDWVSWDDFTQPIDDLWLCIGKRENDGYDLDARVEYVIHEVGTDRLALLNSKDALSDAYQLHMTQGPGLTQIQLDRDTPIFTDPAGDGFGVAIRKKAWVRNAAGQIYLYYEAFDVAPFATESVVKLATASSTDGPWTIQGQVFTPTSIASSGYNIVTGLFMVNDEGASNSQLAWRMYIGAEVDGSAKSEHRMFLFTSPNPNGPWTKQSGPGTDGALLEGTATSTDHDYSGYNDPVVWVDNDAPASSRWKMLCSSLRDGFGWSVNYFTSADGVTWTEYVGNPVIQSTGDGLRSWSGISGRTVTGLSDTVGFERDCIVFIREIDTSDNWFIGRVRKVNATSLELYETPTGVAFAGSNSSIARLGDGSITPHHLDIGRDEAPYVLYTSSFQPFILGVGLGNEELVGLYFADSPEGPWEQQYLREVAAPPSIYGTARNHENIAFLQSPVYSEPAVAPTAVFNISAITPTTFTPTAATASTASFDVIAGSAATNIDFAVAGTATFSVIAGGIGTGAAALRARFVFRAFDAEAGIDTSNCALIDDACENVCLVAVWNIAMGALGLPTIGARGENTRQARAVESIWSVVRRAFLRNAVYNGSKASAKLTLIVGGATHTNRWTYAFSLPSCFIKALTVNGEPVMQGSDKWEIELAANGRTRVLMSNEEEVYLEYVRDIEDINLLDPLAQLALGYFLALELAPRFGKSNTEIETIRKQFYKYQQDARTIDAQEMHPDDLGDWDSYKARL